MRFTTSTTVLLATLLVVPQAVWADATTPDAAKLEPERVLHALGASVLQHWLDTKDYAYGAELEYRLRLPNEVQLGLSGSLLSSEADRIGGYAAADTRRVELRGISALPLGRTGPLALDLRVIGSFAHLASEDHALPDDVGMRAGLELGVLGDVQVTSRLVLRAGFLSPLAFELSPSGELASQGALLLGGFGIAVLDSLLVRGDVQTGGLFGFDGDGTKYDTRVSVGLRWVSAHGARSFNTF